MSVRSPVRRMASVVRCTADARRVVLLLGMPVLLAALGCKDATLGPEGTGSVQGSVLDYETQEPIASASITTSPPSEALITDDSGEFLLEELESGSVQITARKSGYLASTVSVAVRDDRTTSATIFLEEEAEDDSEETAAMLSVDVLSFWNSTENDSTFVDAEYRVRNVGTIEVDRYEVYFRIETASQDHYVEVEGETLRPDQSDVRRFQSFLQQGPATAVVVDTVWFEPAPGSD